MDIGPIFGIPDSLANPRRTEGIRAPQFDISASARAGDDRSPRQQAADHGTADDDAADESDFDQEPEEPLESGPDPLRGTRVNFIA